MADWKTGAQPVVLVDADGVPVSGGTSGGLTDAQLRASPVPVSLPATAAQDGTDATGVTPPTGAVGIRGWLSGLYQRVGTSVGLPADAAATTDTGSFSLLSFVKRSLQNWTTLLGRSTTVNAAKTGQNVHILGQEVFTDAGNSSNAAIGAGASFTGTIVDAQATSSIQVSTFLNQPSTITINQFADAAGNALLSSVTYTRAASVGFSESISITGNFYRVVVTNTGAAVASTVRIQTIQTPLMAGGVPVAVTNLGNYRDAVLEWGGVATAAAVRGGFAPVAPSVPYAASVPTVLTLSTNAVGTTFNAFAAQACTALDIVNNTGVTIEYRYNGAGNAVQIPTGSGRMVIGITNANQVSMRRTDTSNTVVTLQAEAFA